MTAQFFQMPAELLFDANLSDGDRAVYMLVLSFCDYGTTRNAFPSAKQIAERGNRKDRSSVVKSLRKLTDTGWLTRTPRFDHRGQTSSLFGFPRHQNSDSNGRCEDSNPQGVRTKSATTLESVPTHRRQRFTRQAAAQTIHHLALAQHAANMPSDDIEF